MPAYRAIAVSARTSALLLLEATVGADGRVQEVKVLRGQPLFDQAAVDAVKQWRYQPLLLNGVRVPLWRVEQLVVGMIGGLGVQE